MYPEPGAPHHHQHFHARYAGSAAVYRISAITRLNGQLPRPQEDLVLLWAHTHHKGIAAKLGAAPTRQNGFTDCAAFVILCPQETFMKPVLERKLHQIYEVVGFRSLGPYTLEIGFNDGISRKIDFEGVLEGELYGPLKDLTVFQQVKLDREGGNLVWPSGADFDPEILHDWPERKAAMLAAAVRWRKGEYAVRKGSSERASAVEAIWKGSIAFGLVNIPVNLYPATELRGFEVERDNLADD